MAGLTGLPTHGPDYGPDWPLGNTGLDSLLHDIALSSSWIAMAE